MTVILAGMKLTPDRLNNITPQYRAAVTSTQTNTNNNTTLFNVTELVRPVAINGRYRFKLYIKYSATTVADFQMKVVGPAGADVSLWWWWGINAAGTEVNGRSVAGAVTGLGASGTGSPVFFLAEGTIAVAGTAGNVQVQVAKNTAEASTLSIFTSSYMDLELLF